MVESDKKPGVAKILLELFLQKKELCATEARTLMREKGRKTSYVSVQRLFYDLRQLALIEFAKEVPGKAPIAKRYYRIVPGREEDHLWDLYPHYELYPSAKLGGLKYEVGSSIGRAEKYVKGD